MKTKGIEIRRMIKNATVMILALFVVILVSSCSPETMQLCRIGISTEDSSRSLTARITDPLDSLNIYYRTIYKGSGSSYGDMSKTTIFQRLDENGILVSQGLWDIEVLFSEKTTDTIDSTIATNYSYSGSAKNVFINLNTKSIIITLDSSNQSNTGAVVIDKYSLNNLGTMVTNTSVSVSFYKYNGSQFESVGSAISLSNTNNDYSCSSIEMESGLYYAVFNINGTLSGKTGTLFIDTIGFVVRGGLTTNLSGKCETYNQATGHYLVGPVVPSNDYNNNTISISSGDYTTTSDNKFTEIKNGSVYEFTDSLPHVGSDITGQRIPTPNNGTNFAINLKGKDILIKMENGKTTSESALFTTLGNGVLLTIFNNNTTSPAPGTFLEVGDGANSAHKRERRLQTNIELNGPDLSIEGNTSPILNVIGKGAIENISNSSIIFLGPDADNCDTKQTLLEGETKQGSINLSGSGGNITLDGDVELQGFVGISSWSTSLNNGVLTPTITKDLNTTIRVLSGARINVTGDKESGERYSDDAQGIAIYGNNKNGIIEILLDNGSITTSCAGSNATYSSSSPEAGILIDGFGGTINITLRKNSYINSANGNGIVLRNCTGQITINYDNGSMIHGAAGALNISGSPNVTIKKDGSVVTPAMTSITIN